MTKVSLKTLKRKKIWNGRIFSHEFPSKGLSMSEVHSLLTGTDLFTLILPVSQLRGSRTVTDGASSPKIAVYVMHRIFNTNTDSVIHGWFVLVLYDSVVLPLLRNKDVCKDVCIVTSFCILVNAAMLSVFYVTVLKRCKLLCACKLSSFGIIHNRIARFANNRGIRMPV